MSINHDSQNHWEGKALQNMDILYAVYHVFDFFEKTDDPRLNPIKHDLYNFMDKLQTHFPQEKQMEITLQYSSLDLSHMTVEKLIDDCHNIECFFNYVKEFDTKDSIWLDDVIRLERPLIAWISCYTKKLRKYKGDLQRVHYG